MGVQIGEIVTAKEISLEELSGKVVAIDAMNMLHQFLSIIRQRDGEPLMDSKGRITSHLSGLFYRTANLVEMGIKPVYVFDGKPPSLKHLTLDKRTLSREEAEKKWKEALEAGDLTEARKFAQRAGKVTEEMVGQAKRLLQLMGVPWVQAPCEGEAQAAHLVKKGDAWASASQDYDSLLFGAPVLVRNLALTGKRKLPGKDAYVEVKPEQIELRNVLDALCISHEQLVDIGILVGTDFNEGVKGIGPKRALELVRKYGSLERIVKEKLFEFEVDPLKVKELFLRHEVTDDYEIKWGEPNPEKIKEFLCEEFDFSEDRVQSGIEKLTKGKTRAGQLSLERWFG
jgi:flap endonuclease-1